MVTGVIRKWIEVPGRSSFGFATTTDGQDVYLSGALIKRDELSRVDVGTHLEFEIRSAEPDAVLFRRALDAGAYRDKPINHRNPRIRGGYPRKKPAAYNITVVEKNP